MLDSAGLSGRPQQQRFQPAVLSQKSSPGYSAQLRTCIAAFDVVRLLAQPELRKDPKRLAAVALAGGLMMLPQAAQKFIEKYGMADDAYRLLNSERYYGLMYKLKNGTTTTAAQRYSAAFPTLAAGPDMIDGARAGGPLPPPDAAPTRGSIEYAPLEPPPPPPPLPPPPPGPPPPLLNNIAPTAPAAGSHWQGHGRIQPDPSPRP